MEERAFIKMVAGMLNLKFDSLWNRYEREKIERERKEREEKDNLYQQLSQLTSEKYTQSVKRRTSDTVQIMELSSGKELCKLEGVKTTDFSSFGKYELTILDDNTVRICDVSSGEELYRLKYRFGISAAKFSPDGKYIVTVSLDKAIQIWEFSSGKILHVLESFTSGVKSAELSQDGKYVLTTSDDNIARIWELYSGKELYKLEGGKMVEFSPDGKYLIIRR